MRRFIEQRGIESLFHFTNIKNLDSILTRGILPSDILDDYEIPYEYNDEKRLDGRLDTSCISISFPNYKMFYRYRMNSNERYCVIELEPSILYEKECIFCIGNAASNDEKIRNEYDKKGIRGLEQLFYNENLRKRLRLPDYFPTNPQAEVLVPDVIDISHIVGINFDNSVTRNEINLYESKYYNLDIYFEYGEDFFVPRFEYSYWS